MLLRFKAYNYYIRRNGMKNRKQGIVVLLIVFTMALTACDGNPNGGRDTDEDEGPVGGGDPGGVPSTLS